MIVRVAVCQLRPVPGDVDANVDTVVGCMSSGEADVYVFPELFITGYGADYTLLEDDVRRGISRLSEACRELDVAVAISSPRYSDEGIFNSLAFLSPDGDVWYDKAHLARFGVYAEGMFVEGTGPAMGRYHGMGFGLCVCYDVFFPEILHGCSLRRASVNICVAASAVQSKPFLDRVIAARALENVTYLAYVNNVGPLNGLTMHGCSRALDPFGDVVCDCGEEECIRVFSVDTDELERMRSVRRHLQDFRKDIDWLG